MKILAVGDMHLGRIPGSLPTDLGGSELGPAAAWDRVVKTAVSEAVAAVVLAGDVVDSDDDFFEAYRVLESGVRELADADIDIVGVAGNHDVKVLPRLAAQIPEFRLLGAGGQWESCRIAEGADAVTLWGWSFPQTRVSHSPLPKQPFERRPGLNLGLLHCDRDAGSDSTYAPVRGAALAAAGLDGWLLGHIHKPDVLTADAPSGYLGSLTGLDRSESDDHGPWLLTFADGRLDTVEQLSLAPLRWQALEVDLSDIEDAVRAKDRLLAAVRELDRRLASVTQPPSAVGLSVRFTGRTGFSHAAMAELSLEDRDHTYAGAAGTRYFIARLDTDTRPVIDLNVLAKRQDPAGLLAARLLWLDRPPGDPERDALVDAARRQLDDQAGKPVWQGLNGTEGDVDPVAWLRRAAIRALDQLLAQNAEDA